MQLFHFEPTNAHKVIKITIILQHTKSYIFRPILSHHSTLKPVPTLPRWRQVAVTVWQIPDDVDVCAPDDGWRYHPKHAEQFPDKINCITLNLFGYILEYYYDTRTHERKNNIYIL